METLRRELGAGTFRPVYLLYGPEELLKREAAEAISEAVLAGGPKELNENRILWKEASPDAIVDICRTFPMLGARRLVVVSGLDKAKPDELRALAEYLEDPNPTTALVLVGDKLDTRAALFRRAKKIGWVLKAEAPYVDKIPGWLQSRARGKGVRLDPAAANLLADILGNDLVKLDGALERLILFAADPSGPEVRIQLPHVEECIARARVHTVFELADALGRRRAAEAFRILDAMLDSREPPIAILAMLARHIRRLWAAHDALRAGTTDEDVGKRLGVHPFFLRDFIRQARAFDDRELAHLLERAFETDRALKGSRAAPEMHMHRFVLDVCVGEGG